MKCATQLSSWCVMIAWDLGLLQWREYEAEKGDHSVFGSL